MCWFWIKEFRFNIIFISAFFAFKAWSIFFYSIPIIHSCFLYKFSFST